MSRARRWHWGRGEVGEGRLAVRVGSGKHEGHSRAPPGVDLRQQAWASGPRMWALEVTDPLASSLEPRHTQPEPEAGKGAGQWSVAQTRQAGAFED